MLFRGHVNLALIVAVVIAQLVTPAAAFTYRGSLTSMAIVRIYWDLSFFGKDNLTIDKDFSISLSSATDGQNWSPVQLPNYYNSTLNSGPMVLDQVQWELINMASTTLIWTLNVSLLNTPSAGLDSFFSLRKNFQVQQVTISSQFASLVSRATTADHTPPFNLIDPRDNSVMVQMRNSSFLANLYEHKAAFTSSYWNSYGQEVEVVPWIPYLSSCRSSGQRIDLTELMDLFDNSTDSVEDLNIGNLESLLVSRQRSFETQCIFGQSNLDKELIPWWRNEHLALFYLYPTPLTVPEFQTLSASVSHGLSDFTSQLVAVQYRIVGIPLTVPSQVQLSLTYLNYSDSSRKIVRAQLVSYFQSQRPDNSTIVQIRLVPLDQLQEVLQGCATPAIYIIVFLPLLVLTVLVLINLVLEERAYQIITTKITKFLAGVIFKASVLICVSCLLPVAVLLLIGKLTAFSFISYSFDNTSYDSLTLDRMQKGRVGLSLIYSGLYLLVVMVNRTYKIPNREQARILVRQGVQSQNLPQKKRLHELEEKKVNDRAEFMITVLLSRRYRVLFLMMLALVLQCFLYEQLLECNLKLLLVLALIWPLLVNLHVRLVAQKADDMLYALPLYLLGDFVLSAVLTRYKKIWQIILVRTTLTFYYSCYPLLSDLLVMRLYSFLEERPDNRISIFFKQLMEKQKKMKEYDKQLQLILRVAMSMCSCLFRPIMFSLFYFLQKEANMNSTVLPEPNLLSIHYIYIVIQGIMETAGITVIIDQVRKRNGLDILENIEFCFHRFRCRATRWVLDTFKYKETIDLKYRTVEKLCFSSQFYFLVLGMGVSLVLILQGVCIVMRNSFLPYQDPIFFVLLFFISSLGRMLELFVSYVLVRSQLYQLPHEKNRKQLETVSQFSRRDNFEAYLQLEAVKSHFIAFNKQWIVENLPKILTKRNFHESGKRLLNRYIFQLNAQKRKRLLHRKRQVDRQRQLQQNELKKRDQVKILSISREVLSSVVPILTKWLHLSKQQLYLRQFVEPLKKPQPNCEFCKIDMQLEVLERYPFSVIVNRFRVANVGRIFMPQAFVQFYRSQQQLITICFECRLKKEHIHRNQRLEAARSRNNVCARLLIHKWLICARSRILHCSA